MGELEIIKDYPVAAAVLGVLLLFGAKDWIMKIIDFFVISRSKKQDIDGSSSTAILTHKIELDKGGVAGQIDVLKELVEQERAYKEECNRQLEEVRKDLHSQNNVIFRLQTSLDLLVGFLENSSINTEGKLLFEKLKNMKMTEDEN